MASTQFTLPLIVGIGASAGGLDAFTRLFESAPPDTDMAFVLVQHLAPDHKSILADLPGKTTAMRVIAARDGIEIAKHRHGHLLEQRRRNMQPHCARRHALVANGVHG